MLRAHPQGFPHYLRRIPRLVHSWLILPRPYSTTNMVTEKLEGSSPSSAKEPMSPAAIVSVVHQQIVFGRRLRKVGKQAKQPTVLNTSHGQFAHPVEAPTRDEASAPATGFVKPLSGRNTSTGLPLKRRPRIPTSTATDLQTLADDLEAYAAATTSPAGALPRKYRRQSLRPRLLVILAHTQDAACAWAAYRALLVLPRSPEKAASKVPFAHRHRLLRLLAAAPRALCNRGHFAQVLAVLRALHDAGGTIKTWEWNLLLGCVGNGWRRPRQEHFRAALALLAQMRLGSGSIGGVGAGGAAGKPIAVGGDDGGGGGGGGWDSAVLALEPDIFSYTTLLAHAVRTHAPAAVRHAAQLLQRAGLAPGVHAHTALLCFFARCGDLAGVRDTLFRLRQSAGGGLEQVPFNAVLWAFAYNGRVDVAQAMYRVVRARIGEGEERIRWLGEEEEERGGTERGEEEEELVAQLESALAEREMVVIAPEVVPDVATYHILIQAHAYHGDLRLCLETLADMLSAPAPSPPLSFSNDDERQQHAEQQEAQGNWNGQGQLTASLAAFRSIFLGFARHGVAPHTPSPLPPRSHNHPLPTDDDDEMADTPTSLPTSTSTRNRDRNRSRSRSRSGRWDTTTRSNDGKNEWTLATLEALFAQFLELPRDTPLRESTLFWLVSAFEHASGHDPVALRRVFERVEDRFGQSASSLTYGGTNRQGRLGRIRERVFLA